METFSFEKNEPYKNQNISILNKINHKPLLLEKIFSFCSIRPIVLPYLINKDYILSI